MKRKGHGERFNSISHLIGALAAVVGFVVLLAVALREGDPWKIFSFSVYGTTLLMLYTASSLFHGVQGSWKDTFRKLDYFAIYLLIAGTYTPFALVTLRDGPGWAVFASVWTLAAIGIVIDLFQQRGPRITSLTIYLVMGWLCLTVIRTVIRVLPPEAFAWLMVGGLAYTIGLAFYFLDQKVRHAHGIWHLFVLTGSLSHYWVVLFYVA